MNINLNLNFAGIGSIYCGLSVVFGAFGAHALKSGFTTYQLEIFETAARYQMYHGLALLLTGVISGQNRSSLVKFAGLGFTVGTLIFSGSLYALCFSGVRWLGAVTPIGGATLILSWALLSFGTFVKKS